MIDWLADTFLATTLLMGAVLLIREPVRKQFGPAVAYGLWLIPAIRILMPTLTTTVERTVPAAEPLSASAAPLYAASLAAPSNSAPSDSGLLDFAIHWTHVVLAVWLIGAVAFLVRGAAIYLKQRNVVLGDSIQLAKLDGIRIVRSAAVRGPMAFGVIDRIIALPLDFDQRYDANQRRLALDHELAHHKSGDLVANHFAFVLLCLQWFNPLAWASHAAFRFDQEAACDARVLDKANGQDRAVYGQTIAMAASGRALLFAGALDRPSTLQRRLRSMLSRPNEKRRFTGKALIAMTAIAALPLTASWATLYVDVPAPTAPTAPAAPLAPMAQASLAPLAPTAPQAPTAPVAPVAPVAPMQIDGENITINGQTKRWQDLTPAEREQVRRDIAKARAELANTKIDRAEIDREVREAMAELQQNRQEVARDLAEARIDVVEAMREIDANAAEIRRAGQDPEQIKAQVRASLKAVEAIDIEAITRQALASVDPQVIAASVAAAEASIARAEAEMERLERRLDQIDAKE